MRMERDNPLVSIIVPVYNVANYLKKCLDSLVAQTYRAIEIILIDDGSTDTSGQICDTYNQKFKNIIVVHSTNSGQAAARNKGLSLATGEYIGFVDSDDWVEPDMYESLVNTALLENSDMVMCGYKACYPNKIIEFSRNTYKTENLSVIEFVNGLQTQKTKCVVWNKLFKREMLKSVFFVEGQLFEDAYFINDILRKRMSMCYIDAALYNYRLGRPGSTVSSFDNKRVNVLLEFNKFLNELYETYNKEDLIYYRIYLQQFSMNLYYQAVLHNANCRILITIYYFVKSLDLKYFHDISKYSGIKEFIEHILFIYAPKMWYRLKRILAGRR